MFNLSDQSYVHDQTFAVFEDVKCLLSLRRCSLSILSSLFVGDVLFGICGSAKDWERHWRPQILTLIRHSSETSNACCLGTGTTKGSSLKKDVMGKGEELQWLSLTHR